VEAEDEAVGVAGVVVLGDLEGVLAAVDGLDARGEGGLTAAAAGGLCQHSGGEGRDGDKGLGCHGDGMRLDQRVKGVDERVEVVG
jgi:hypothetical protein